MHVTQGAYGSCTPSLPPWRDSQIADAIRSLCRVTSALGNLQPATSTSWLTGADTAAQKFGIAPAKFCSHASQIWSTLARKVTVVRLRALSHFFLVLSGSQCNSGHLQPLHHAGLTDGGRHQTQLSRRPQMNLLDSKHDKVPVFSATSKAQAATATVKFSPYHAA